MSLLKKVFGKNVPQKKKPSLSGRHLRMESLENRELLSVAPAYYEDLRTHYSDLNLSANSDDYNFIIVESAQLNSGTIRKAIEDAGKNTKHDIVIFETTASQNLLTLDKQIDIFAKNADVGTSMNTITFVSWGVVPLTIDSQNHRAFKIDSVDVNFVGMTVKNGRVSVNSTSATTLTDTSTAGNGGAIYNYNGKLGIYESIFEANYCTGAYGSGGAIFSWKGSVELVNSTFKGNETALTTGCMGGGVYVAYADLSVSDTTFTRNKAYLGGGLASGDSGNITVTNDSTVELNTSSNDGAGIYAKTGRLEVRDSKVFKNTSKGDGAGIYQKTGDLYLHNATIEGNMALTTSETSTSAKGGGVFSGGNVTIEKSRLLTNKAGSGGGFYGSTVGTEILITDSTVSGNTAQSYGGGIYTGSSTSIVKILGSQISDNEALNYTGGGIYNAATLTLGYTLEADGRYNYNLINGILKPAINWSFSKT